MTFEPHGGANRYLDRAIRRLRAIRTAATPAANITEGIPRMECLALLEEIERLQRLQREAGAIVREAKKLIEDEESGS